MKNRAFTFTTPLKLRETHRCDVMMIPKQRVLFICIHNSIRSQIAEGYMNARLGDRFEALSAGMEKTRVHPMAIEVMEDLGIDISGQQSKALDEFLGESFDIMVTVCDPAQGSCPFYPGATRLIHKSFPDPSQYTGSTDKVREEFRRVRDEIIHWIEREFHP